MSVSNWMDKIKRRNIFIVVGMAVFTLTIIYYLYRTNFSQRNVLLLEPRNPQNEIPVTYRLDWMPYQEALLIDSFNVQIVESNLSMFNTVSLVAYEVSGRLINKPRKAIIEQVHVSDRENKDTTLHVDRVVELTPIIKYDDQAVKEPESSFKFRNEMLINSMH